MDFFPLVYCYDFYPHTNRDLHLVELCGDGEREGGGVGAVPSGEFLTFSKVIRKSLRKFLGTV